MQTHDNNYIYLDRAMEKRRAMIVPCTYIQVSVVSSIGIRLDKDADIDVFSVSLLRSTSESCIFRCNDRCSSSFVLEIH